MSNLSSKRDLNLAIGTLSKIDQTLSSSASCQMSIYAREVNKRRRIDQMDHSHVLTKFGTRKVSKELQFARSACKTYLKKAAIDLTPETKKRSGWHPAFIKIRSSPTCEICIHCPSDGSVYTPTEVCKILSANFAEKDRSYVLRQLIKRRYVPVKLQMTLRHMQWFKEGRELP